MERGENLEIVSRNQMQKGRNIENGNLLSLQFLIFIIDLVRKTRRKNPELDPKIISESV